MRELLRFYCQNQFVKCLLYVVLAGETDLTGDVLVNVLRVDPFVHSITLVILERFAFPTVGDVVLCTSSFLDGLVFQTFLFVSACFLQSIPGSHNCWHGTRSYVESLRFKNVWSIKFRTYIRMRASCIAASSLLAGSGTTPTPNFDYMWDQFRTTHGRVYN